MTKVISRFPLLVSKKEVQENRRRRYTQKEIADMTGLSPSVISRWMRGGEVDGANLETVQKLAQWLEVDIKDLTEVVEA